MIQNIPTPEKAESRLVLERHRRTAELMKFVGVKKPPRRTLT